jgi:hypothetical protein
MIIKDKLIEPYEIHFDGVQYTLGKPYVNKHNKEMLLNTTYHTKLDNVILKVVANKIGEESTIVSLKEFYKKFSTMLEEFKTKITLE